ncbi:MAG: helix-hairpin-helix domain-containing protein [bacterium]
MSFLSKLLKRDAEPTKPADDAVPAAPPPPTAPMAPPSKPAAAATPDLDRIRKELLEIASIVGDGGETRINASPDSMVELRFSDIIKIAPQAFTGVDGVSSIGELELAVVVPNLYDQLAKGKVTTTLRNLTADVPSEHVSQYTLDHGEDMISLPLPLVIQAVQPNELKKRTATKERDLGQNRLPNLFTPGKTKLPASAGATPPPAAKPEAHPTVAKPPAISSAELAAAAEKIRNFRPVEKQTPAGEAKVPSPPFEKPPEPVKPPPVEEEVKAAIVETPPPVPKVEEAKPAPEPEPAHVDEVAPPPPSEPPKVEEPPVASKPEPVPELDGEEAEEEIESEVEELVASAEAISKQNIVVSPEPVEHPVADFAPPTAQPSSPPSDIVKVDEEPEPALVDAAPKPGAVMLNGIDVNSASVDELVHRLNSVGRKLAEKIVEERGVGGNFKNLLDLSRVPGVRGKKFERITGIAWRSELHKHRELIQQLVGVDDSTIPDVRAVAARFKELKAYIGCVIILEDGYVLASNWENVSSDALAAFAPQMFKKIGKYVNHLKLGSIRCLTFFTEEQPITIVRSGKIFFAAVHVQNNFGRKQVEVVQALAEELGGRMVG